MDAADVAPVAPSIAITFVLAIIFVKTLFSFVSCYIFCHQFFRFLAFFYDLSFVLKESPSIGPCRRVPLLLTNNPSVPISSNGDASSNELTAMHA